MDHHCYIDVHHDTNADSHRDVHSDIYIYAHFHFIANVDVNLYTNPIPEPNGYAYSNGGPDHIYFLGLKGFPADGTTGPGRGGCKQR